MVPIPRRSVLVSLGTASFSIAGCLGPSDPSTSPTTESATQPSETSAEGPTDITLTIPEVRKNLVADLGSWGDLRHWSGQFLTVGWDRYPSGPPSTSTTYSDSRYRPA